MAAECKEQTQLWLVQVGVTIFFLYKLASLVGFCLIEAALDRVRRSTLEVVEAQTIH